ncbi:cAMP-regulated D2 protein-like [Babylonia areolata]|uniref:cAMP-regulated D2 protein-like n=1 Tax=Babylonia areolata TaxID=304850 RepID=UPI003FD69418
MGTPWVMVMATAAVAQLLAWLPPCHSIADSLVVSVPGGRVQGHLRSGAIRFLGIPFATAHRFQYPSSSVPSWKGLLNASLPGPQCPQHCPRVIRDLYCVPGNQMSESCLTLNIFRPAYNLPSDHAFPVMVYIHGGGFEAGSGGAPLYTGDYLARVGGVILVTINYRLGALGFLPIFNSYDDVIGNFGFRDQQVALQWVKQNIGNFKGDPNKVTLFGAEAGCQSVGLHLTSFTSDPLFHAAILHSCPFTLPFRGKNESQQTAADFAKALGCPQNDVSCLRGKPMQAILEAQKKVSNDASSGEPASLRKFQVWGPIVDKRMVYDANLLEELTHSNLEHTKPVMVGYVAGEGVSDVYRKFPLPVQHYYLERIVRSTFPDKWRQVAGTPLAPYQASSGDQNDARARMIRFLHDFVYTCPAHRFAGRLAANAGRSLAGRSPAKVWMYKFDPKVMWSPGFSAWPPGGETDCRKEVCQGLDLLYLFHPPAVPEAQQARTSGLTRAMTFYWTNFAKYHNPNGHHHHDASQSAASLGGLSAQGLVSLVRSGGRGGGGGGMGFPAPRQLASAVVRHSSLSAGYFVSPLMLAQTRVASPVTSSSLSSSLPGVVAWPTYVTRNPLTSSDVNATLVLTQPSPTPQWSPFGDGCEFWERVGFS